MPTVPGPGPATTTADVVRLLRPRAAADPVPVPDDIRDLLGPGPLAWIREMAVATTDLVAELHPGTDPFPWDVITRSSESSLVELVVELAGGRLAMRAFNEPRTVVLHEVVRDGVELPTVLSVTRACQRLWTETLLDHAIAARASPTVLREIAVTVARGYDSIAHAWNRAYPAESDRLANTVAVRRWRVVDDLLADPERVDPDVARQTMAVELDDHHLCVVVHATAADPAGLLAAGVAAVEAAVVRTARSRRVVVHERGADERWVWVSGPQAAGPTDLRELRMASGLRVGAGGRHPGADGFRRSTLEAGEACRLAVRTGAATPVLHDDVALVGLLSRDPERAAWFVETCLGPLAGPDPYSAVLRATLCTFYTSGMRLTSTAADLDLHRNSLVNRLRRIEALLGRPVTDRATETYCALLLLDVLPDLAVTPAVT